MRIGEGNTVFELNTTRKDNLPSRELLVVWGIRGRETDSLGSRGMSGKKNG